MARRTRPKPNFNSRPSARGDAQATNPAVTSFISIHAPPRGATSTARCNDSRGHDFNSRPSARGDSTYAALCALGYISIHAPPRGATHLRLRQYRAKNYFNSRPSARGDPPSSTQDAPDYVFQFTPLREGRQPPQLLLPHPQKFQFTPLREGRPPLLTFRRGAAHFNSRPSARGDRLRSDTQTYRNISIHAPPRGATPPTSPISSEKLFQFTPLREGRHDKKRRDAVVLIFQFTPLREGRRQKICNFCKSFVQPLQISMA